MAKVHYIVGRPHPSGGDKLVMELSRHRTLAAAQHARTKRGPMAYVYRCEKFHCKRVR